MQNIDCLHKTQIIYQNHWFSTEKIDLFRLKIKNFIQDSNIILQDVFKENNKFW